MWADRQRDMLITNWQYFAPSSWRSNSQLHARDPGVGTILSTPAVVRRRKVLNFHPIHQRALRVWHSYSGRNWATGLLRCLSVRHYNHIFCDLKLLAYLLPSIARLQKQRGANCRKADQASFVVKFSCWDWWHSYDQFMNRICVAVASSAFHDTADTFILIQSVSDLSSNS